MNLNGNWTGTIFYGPEYGDWENKELFFKMTIEQTNDTFSAIAFDTGGLGVNPDSAVINGFISGNEISFTKQYQSTLTYDDEGQLIVLKNKPSPTLDYTGVYDPLTDKLSGEWVIDIFIKQFNDEMLFETFTGHWTMNRE